MTEPLQIKPYLEERTFSDGDIPLLTASSHLPQWTGDGGARFNRYYRAYARAFERYCETVLFPSVQASYHQALTHGGVIPDCHVTLRTTITCQQGDLISLYTDSIENSGGQRMILRRGDTWDMESGTPLRLVDFFSPHTLVRKRLLSAAYAQIQQEERLGLYRYLPDWSGRIRRSFNPRNFYINEEGLTFFYQFCTIAPPTEGIPAFFLPYDEEKGPRWQQIGRL